MTDSKMNELKSSDRLKQEVDKEQGLTLFKFQQTVTYDSITAACNQLNKSFYTIKKLSTKNNETN